MTYGKFLSLNFLLNFVVLLFLPTLTLAYPEPDVIGPDIQIILRDIPVFFANEGP